jgi:hypothetical protein
VIETAWCLGVIAAGLLGIGLPVQWLLGGRRPLEERDWVRAPFLGLATIVLAGEALAFQDVPLARSTPVLWASAAALWAWMWRRGAVRRGSVPLPLMGAAVGVYLVHGCGLVLAGAHSYVGRAWGDQFNYTVYAEFLREQPFSLGLDQVGLRPYLFMPVLMKGHRLGQSVLHAFFSQSALRDVKTMFEPVILLSPALAFLALHELRTVLVGAPARGWSLLAGTAPALLPGLALSQCLALPLLLLGPVLLWEMVLEATTGRLMTAGLIAAAITATYPELLPIVFGLTLAGLGVAAPRHPRRRRLLAALAVLPLSVAPFALTPAWGGLAETMGYVGKSVLGHLYPWALSLEGLGRIWSGDLVEAGGRALRAVLLAAAAILTAAGYLGLFHRLVRESLAGNGGSGPERAAARTHATSVGLLVLLPLVVLVQKGEHPYQFYKLALTIAPLIALGVTLIPVPLVRRPLLALMLALALGGTTWMGAGAGRGRPGPRSMAEYLLYLDAQRLPQALASLGGRDVALLHRDPEGRPRGVLNAWMTFFSRHSRVRLGNPILNQDVDLLKQPDAHAILDLASLPPRTVFLSSAGDPWPTVPGGARTLWSGPGFVLWEPPPSGPWITLLTVRNPNGLEDVRGDRFFWLGGEDTRLFVLAGQAGTLRASAEFLLGPGAHGSRRAVRVDTSAGHQQTVHLAQGPGTIEVPVLQGVQEVRLRPLDRGTPAGADPRPLVLGVFGLRLSLVAQP